MDTIAGDKVVVEDMVAEGTASLDIVEADRAWADMPFELHQIDDVVVAVNTVVAAALGGPVAVG